MGSIINDKYKGQYRAPADWVRETLNAAIARTRTIEKKVKAEDGAETVTTREVADGKSIDALFDIAAENKLGVEKYQKNRDNPGFPGRFSMVVGNMLRASIKRRHGMFVNGTWLEAPASWLSENNAPAEPTETADGEKITKAKPAKEANGGVEDTTSEDQAPEAIEVPLKKRRQRANAA